MKSKRAEMVSYFYCMFRARYITGVLLCKIIEIIIAVDGIIIESKILAYMLLKTCGSLLSDRYTHSTQAAPSTVMRTTVMR